MKRTAYTLALTLSAALIASPVDAEQLLESGSFEWPPTTKRKARSEGGDVSKSAMNAEWISFKDKTDAEDGGRIILGVTNETARTGRQSLFVQFDKLTKPLATSELASDLISILPGKPYRIAIWGRVDRREPVALDQRLPYLKLRVDWFMADREEQTGEVVWRVQPLPGAKNRKPLFVTSEWREYHLETVAPANAAFMKITWFWETTPEAGETNGVMYFDDITIEGEPGPKVVEEIVEEEAPAPSTPTPAPAAREEPAKPAPTAPANPQITPAPDERPVNITPLR